MKFIYSLLALCLTFFGSANVWAQCTGTISASGSGATFTFTSTNPTSAQQMHSWDFGDGTYGTGQTTTHTYTTSGTYPVIAYFGDSINMCADVDTISITATVSGGTTCSAAFNTTGTSPTFTFTPTSTPTAPPGYYSYDWDFGDGNVAWGNNNPTHTYTANGTYYVTCTLYDSIWCSDTITDSVVVTGINSPSCNSAFTYSDSNGTVAFTPTHPFPGAVYSWIFGDGNTSSLQNPVHTYATGGTYNVWFQISEPNGCFDSTLVSIQVGSTPTCDASFSTTNNGATYSFSLNNANSSANYWWDFGDGNTSNVPSPSHTYTSNGTYTISCSMIIPSVCGDSSFTTVTVNSIPTHGSISGVVNMGNSYADYGVVFLISNDSNNILSLVDTAFIDSLGMYYFTNVPYGTYLLKAALAPNSSNYSNYLPSYYAGAVGELLWSNASDVILNTPFLNYLDINLVSGTNPGGSGFIGGLVSQGANKAGDPLSDINIMVLDDLGNPVAYTYSDNTGSFQISNLANGTYTVYPEVQGRTTTPIDVVITNQNIGTNDIRVEVNSTTVEATIVTGIKPIVDNNSVQLYPNPVQNELHVEWNTLESKPVTYRVMDITGKVLESFPGISGTHLIINTSNYQSGIYFLSVQTGEKISKLKFVK